MDCLRTAFWASFLWLAPALAAAAPPDRSALSYEENAAINAACFEAGRHGAGARDDCVRRQMAALEAHPTPDRSGLSAARNAAILRQCAHLRRAGIAPYNDCLAKAMAAPAPAKADEEDGLLPNLQAAYADAQREPKKEGAEPAAAAPLPPPREALPRRPGQLETRVLEPTEIYRRVERSIYIVMAVRTLADVRSREVALGSAVAVGPHELLTNCHVVEDRPLIRILQDGAPTRATLVAADAKNDRCVIRSEGPPLAAVQGVRPYAEIAIGERVYAVGAPRGVERTLSEGLVSGLRRFGGRHMVQTNAPISPGSSGGGLFDAHGNLIGVTTLGSRAGTQNLNFAIPAAEYWE